jgi:hypothetical protein
MSTHFLSIASYLQRFEFLFAQFWCIKSFRALLWVNELIFAGIKPSITVKNLH